jgi:AbrB family looped-hinge helix DNA binding protein
MDKYISSVSPKGQVTIPVKYREQLGISTKDRVLFEERDGYLILRPVGSPVDRLFGSVKPLDEDVPWEVIRERAWEEQVARIMEETFEDEQQEDIA